jgi:UDP-N-acetylmuramate--alanine ligase
MHIFFSGIGGAGIGPLALIAKQAGYEVSGSDRQDSSYVTNLRAKGIHTIHIGQTMKAIDELHTKRPIDWIVYSSAVPKENPNHPELLFARDKGIKNSKRDEFLQKLLQDTGQKLVAIAGTHGKTTTTAMVIWLFNELDVPLSYSVGGKLSFGGVGKFSAEADYFVYEADEYDRNFLTFSPYMSAIPGIDYDHPDIYPTRESYYGAFTDFLQQSAHTILWEADANKLSLGESDSTTILASKTDLSDIRLSGKVNRLNAHLAIVTAEKLGLCDYQTGIEIMCRFPGISRRFEKLAENLYTDYAHTPEKIKGALQLTQEISKDVIVVYEGLHNTRQHFIKDELKNIFKGAKKIYVVPSYLAREDQSLELLTPEKICALIDEPDDKRPSELNDDLKSAIETHIKENDLVLCLTAGGGGSLDEWLRASFVAD